MTKTKLLKDPEKDLKDVLADEYLARIGSWLLGKEGNAYLLAQAGNSSWECALSIFFLLEFYDHIEEHHLINKEGIKSKVLATVRWMMHRAVKEESLVNWEGVTWDTAVVPRAFSLALEKFPSAFSEGEKKEITGLIEKGLGWLAQRFSLWEEEVTYPYGPSDIAQILITLENLKRREPTLLSEGLEPFTTPDELMYDIAEYLHAHAQEIEVSLPGAKTSAKYWSDPFQSAEVMYSLARFVNLKRDFGARDDEESLVEECEKDINKCLFYAESKQENGRWGTHSDTCRMLWSYVATTALIENVNPEIHIVVKSIRWLCDEKQTFEDGSYLHTMFLTVFYGSALLKVYQHLPEAQKPTIKVMDDALWATPVRTNLERKKRLKLEVQNKRLEREKSQEKNQLEEEKRQVIVEKARILSSGILFILLLIASFVVPFGLGWIGVSFNIQPELRTIFPYISIVIVVSIAIMGLVYRYLTPS